jgi:hypothetical protein
VPPPTNVNTEEHAPAETDRETIIKERAEDIAREAREEREEREVEA